MSSSLSASGIRNLIGQLESLEAAQIQAEGEPVQQKVERVIPEVISDRVAGFLVVVGWWLLVDCWLLVVGGWFLVVGGWLVFGGWWLVVGCWLCWLC